MSSDDFGRVDLTLPTLDDVEDFASDVAFETPDRLKLGMALSHALGHVGLGSRVVVLDLNKDEELSYSLVTSEDADVSQGRISTSSPIGKGLLGKRVGDTVRIQIPDGTRELEILQLATIHDEATKQ